MLVRSETLGRTVSIPWLCDPVLAHYLVNEAPYSISAFGLTKKALDARCLSQLGVTKTSWLRTMAPDVYSEYCHITKKPLGSSGRPKLIDMVRLVTRVSRMDVLSVRDDGAVEVSCRDCSARYTRSGTQAMSGARCRSCSQPRGASAPNFVSEEEFLLSMEREHPGWMNRWVMGEYVSSSKSTTFSCTGCGHKITCSPGHFRSWRSITCSRCIAASGFYSYGELLVGACLSSAGIVYDSQMRVSSSTGRVMYADFFLPEYGLAIEYHGAQHYSGGRFSHRRSLSEQRKRDSSLREALIGLGFGYVEIPYTAHTIDLVASCLSEAIGVNIDIEAARCELRRTARISDVISFYSSHSLGDTLDRFKLSRSTVDQWFKDAIGCTKREYTKMQARRLISEDTFTDWETAQAAILNTTGELRKRSYVLILMREARYEQQS